jgi:hypothetical protein
VCSGCVLAWTPKAGTIFHKAPRRPELREASKDGESTPARIRAKPQKACIAGVVTSNVTWYYGVVLKLDSRFLDNAENNAEIVRLIVSRGQAQKVAAPIYLEV